MSFNIFLIYLFAYMEMSKDSPAKHYQNNIERLEKKKKKKTRGKFQSLSKEEEEKNKMVLKGTKIYQKRKNKSWLVEYKKIIIK